MASKSLHPDMPDSKPRRAMTQTVLITGAKLAQVATELQNQCGVKVRTVGLDLASLPAPQFLFDRLQREGVAIDILINSAGFGAFGEFAQMPEQEILGQIQLNVTALTHLTRLFLPPMVARRRGRIMNVASTAAFQPGPLMGVYYATKAYALSLSEALANELGGSGVTVMCFCPGPTNTNFAKRAGNDNTRMFKSIGGMNAERAARDGYRGLMAERTVVISGLRNWLVAESVRFAPRKMVTAISRWIGEKVELGRAERLCQGARRSCGAPTAEEFSSSLDRVTLSTKTRITRTAWNWCRLPHSRS